MKLITLITNFIIISEEILNVVFNNLIIYSFYIKN